MASKPYVELVFSGDATKLTKALTKVGKDTQDTAKDVTTSSDKMVSKLGDVEKAGEKIKPVDMKVSVTGDGQSVASLSGVSDAGSKIKNADAKVSVSGDGEAKSKLSEVDKAGQNIKPAKVKVEAESGDVKDKFKEAGKTGADAFGVGFVSGIASGDFVGAASDIISEAFAKSAENNKLNKNIQNQMGVSPEQAREYGGRISEQYAKGISDSKEPIAAAYSSLSSESKIWDKATDASRDKMVESAVKISSAFGVDVQEPIKAVASLMSSGLATSVGQANDIITSAFRNLGARGDDALETLKEYPQYFEQLGIKGPQALSLIDQALEAGARDTDTAADMWKELGIRAIDGTKAVSDALTDLGLDSKKIPAAIAAGGPAAEAAVEQIIKKLQDMKDPLRRNIDGAALMGGQWEDTGKKVIPALDMTKAKMMDVAGATDSLVATSNSASDQIGRRWDRGSQVLGDWMSQRALDVGNWFDSLTNPTPWATLYGLAHDSENGIHSLFDDMKIGAMTAAGQVNLFGREVITMAEGAQGNGTRAMRNLLAAMSDTDLAAFGASRSINKAHQEVITLPDGKQITISAKDEASGTISSIANRNYTAVIRLKGEWAGFYGLPSGVVLSGSSARGNAGGGWIRGAGTRTSDSIPRMLSNDEFVVNAEDANKGDNPSILEAINSGASMPGPRSAFSGSSVPFSGGGGGGTVAVTLVIKSAGDSVSDYEVRRFRSMVQLVGGGVVQTAGGGRS